MNTVNDLGQVTATTVEWGTRFHYRNGEVRTTEPTVEDHARLVAESVQAHLDDVAANPGKSTRAESVELVSRTRYDYDSGAHAYTAWTVAE